MQAIRMADPKDDSRPMMMPYCVLLSPSIVKTVSGGLRRSIALLNGGRSLASPPRRLAFAARPESDHNLVVVAIGLLSRDV